MSIYENLKADHQRVSGLFVKLQQTNTTDTKEREMVFNQLKNELIAHSKVEEKIFYSELLKYPETEFLIAQSESEHDKVEQILNQLDSMPKSDSEWLHIALKLKSNVEAHVEKEETEVFSHARIVISREQANEMGILFKIEKDKFVKVNV